MGLIKDIREDIQAVLARDPAARTSLEVLLCYPGVWALIFHRPAHWLYKHNMKLIARIISQLARFLTGIEIHPAPPSAAMFYRPRHGCRHRRDHRNRRRRYHISGCYPWRRGKETGKRHPTIGNNVMITAVPRFGPFQSG